MVASRIAGRYVERAIKLGKREYRKGWKL